MNQYWKPPAAAMLLAALFAMPALSADDGWIVLFDGTDLSAWDNGAGGAPGAGWVIEDGAVTRKERAGYLWSKQQFGDFILEIEFKTQGNSGIFFRTGNPRDCVQTGFEMQVMTPSPTTSKHSVGALYDALEPSKAAGVTGWNKVVIMCKGSKVTFDLNGERIIDADLNQWTEAGKNPDGTKNKYKKALKDFPRKGYIGLQEHGSVVSFRNIRVKEL